MQIVDFTFQLGELCALPAAGNLDQSAHCLGIVERRGRQLLKADSCSSRWLLIWQTACGCSGSNVFCELAIASLCSASRLAL
jgi:hypothetical protein